MASKVEIRQEYRASIRSQQVLVVVFTCSVITFILMSLCLISSYWITSDGFRQGLLYLCIEQQDAVSRGRYESLPFDLNRDELEPGCYPNRNVGKSHEKKTIRSLDNLVTNMILKTRLGYLKVCTFFCLITQLSAIASACLTGIGIRVTGIKRASCLRFAVCTTLVTLLCDMALLIVYPTQFYKELNKSNRDVWELNGAFGLACGAGILSLGSLFLIITSLKFGKSILRVDL